MNLLTWMMQCRKRLKTLRIKNNFNPTKTQAEEILQRYGRIKHIMQQTVSEPDPLQKSLFTEKLDNILLHRRWGYLILLAVLFLLFQSVFWLAQYPMDWIDLGFAKLNHFLSMLLPDNLVDGSFNKWCNGGTKWHLVFVPQIMILFGLITLLEDTGYMARISFLTDRLMRSVGLNGKSVMPMISGFACAVPAIMSARNIENRKERLLTILITPLMSCSARLAGIYNFDWSCYSKNLSVWFFRITGFGYDGTLFIGHCNGLDRFLCSKMVY